MCRCYWPQQEWCCAYSALPPRALRKAEEEHWYSFFWPLGEKKAAENLKDEYVPFRTERGSGKGNREDVESEQADESTWYSSIFSLGSDQDRLKEEFSPVDATRDLPPRPDLLAEIGDGFLDTGQLDAGFEVPIIGAVWQPRLWSYFIYRTAVQTFDAGANNAERETEWAHRLDLFVNLQLTGTEKILLGLRPLDNNRANEFTRYTFKGRNEGWNDEFNYIPETLFFEGDLGSLFPVFDRAGVIPLDFGFTVGRQPITFQEGILINDTLDAVGLIRNNIPVPGFRTSVHRPCGPGTGSTAEDLSRNPDENLFGLFTAADGQVSTYNLDLIYVQDDSNGDGLLLRRLGDPAHCGLGRHFYRVPDQRLRRPGG